MRLITFLALFTGALAGLNLYGQTCNANGCDGLIVADVRAELALWMVGASDCNDDNSSDIRDFVCMFSIVPDYDPPSLSPIGNQTIEIANTLSFTVDASDPNGDVLHYYMDRPLDNAELDHNTGLFTFTPQNLQRGEITRIFYVSDGFLTDFEVVSFLVTGLIADDQDLVTQEEISLEVTLTTSQSTGAVAFEVVEQPSHGLLTGEPPQLTYTPATDFNGVDSFRFTVTDDLGTSLPGTVRIDVTPVNDAPVAQSRQLVIAAETIHDLTLEAIDVDNTSLTFTITELPVNGSLEGTPPSLTYTPQPGFTGTDQFVYTVSDGEFESEPAIVFISVGLPAPVVDPHQELVTQTSITISGRVELGDEMEITSPTGTITVPVVGGAFSADISLQENTRNTIFFTALLGGLRGPPAATRVIHDLLPPSLSILFPPNGAELATTGTDVAGTVGDLLSGFTGLTVDVNGVQAEVDIGIGTNGTFLAENVPLTPGFNDLTATAIDSNGNVVSQTITVLHELPGAGDAVLSMVSGNAQVATVDTLLANPVVVQLNHADGSPFAGKTVTFRVTRSNGRLSADGTGEGSAVYRVHTDDQGLASVYWQMGMDAGCGNNRLEVFSAGVTGSVFFCASANPAAARQINLGSGNNQRGEAGAPACEPLIVWVSDSCNGAEGVPVTFSVVEGDGSINGDSTVTVFTGDTGHVSVNATLGAEPGNNVYEADFPGNPGAPVRFSLQGSFRDETRATVFEGLVIDNANRPIGGAEVRLVVNGMALPSSTTDTAGLFVFEDIPAGPADLYVDGLTATELAGVPISEGSFPSLHFMPIITPNAVNSLATPVKLPPLNPENAVLFDNTRDVVLTIAGVEGLEMHVKAGSMTRPDGSRPSVFDPAILSLNAVQADDVPMPMPDGAAPPFAWTLQPGGALFDPPIEVVYPNMSGLEPGSIAYFLSFNHATNNFEIVASSTVTGDGASIITDPGAGISVAGWGCNCPPYSVTGECENCEPMETPCLSYSTSSEFDRARDMINGVLDKVNNIPQINAEVTSFSGGFEGSLCPSCCEGEERPRSKVTVTGSVSAAGSLFLSPSPLNRNFRVRKRAFGIELDFQANLQLGPSVTFEPNITITASGSYDFCNGSTCLSLSGNASVGITLALTGSATVSVSVNGHDPFNVGITAEASVSTTANGSARWTSEDCDQSSGIEGCMDDLTGRVTLEMDFLDYIDVNWESPTVLFYGGNCN